jgi:NAD(P)-dependent dehydrogenase (short-subunit alcohol dehydrogenase family)
MRAVVVGASSGLGKALAIGLAQRGAKVALLARRSDALMQAAAEAGSGALGICCDATDPDACYAAVDAAAAGLGGIDAAVYAPGAGTLSRIEDISSETWHSVFATNVVGASHVTAAALPHLRTSSGVMSYLTSMSASLTPTWPGLAVYTVTKAALDKLVEAWRVEHPDVSFTRFVLGNFGADADSEFSADWDPELAAAFYPTWIGRGLLTDTPIAVEDFVQVVASVLRYGGAASVPSVAITPRRPI